MGVCIQVSGLLKALYSRHPWQSYSIKNHLNFSEKHSAMRRLLVQTLTTVYSQILIRTAERTGTTLSEKPAHGFILQHRIWTRVILVGSLKLYPSVLTHYTSVLTDLTLWLTLAHWVPTTRHVTSLPILLAAVIVCSVLGCSLALSCSATTSVLCRRYNCKHRIDDYRVGDTKLKLLCSLK